MALVDQRQTKTCGLVETGEDPHDEHFKSKVAESLRPSLRRGSVRSCFKLVVGASDSESESGSRPVPA